MYSFLKIIINDEIYFQVFEDNVNFSSDEDNPPIVDDTQLENNINLCKTSMFDLCLILK